MIVALADAKLSVFVGSYAEIRVPELLLDEVHGGLLVSQLSRMCVLKFGSTFIGDVSMRTREFSAVKPANGAMSEIWFPERERKATLAQYSIPDRSTIPLSYASRYFRGSKSISQIGPVGLAIQYIWHAF